MFSAHDQESQMRRNTKTIAAAGLIQTPRELRAVCRGKSFLNDVREIPLSDSLTVFKSVLETDGSITVRGHSWRDGFPSYPLAAVRNLAEGRKLLDPVKPTGGWPYWHYLDEVTGKWENLAHLWERSVHKEGAESSV
jgi:hypothetical protein